MGMSNVAERRSEKEYWERNRGVNSVGSGNDSSAAAAKTDVC
jgi:hypothetical protein